MSLLDVRHLTVSFGQERAVRDMTFTVEPGETAALVGESGSGKSTTALAIMRLLSPASRVSGEILFAGRGMSSLSAAQVRQLRGSQISMIFQEPMSSLNPVMTVGAQLMEAIQLQQRMPGRAARERAVELLNVVKISSPAQRVDDYPHTFSGGQRQRVMIAMAVARRPRLLIADEPTTALDAATQAQIFELLDKLRHELSMALLLITHDLGAVRRWADRVMVMHDGVKIEEGRTDALFSHPSHAYTRGLLAASLSLEGDLHYRTARLAEGADAGAPFAADVETALALPPARRPAYAQVERLAAESSPPLLRLNDLHVVYQSRNGRNEAVDGVSFDIAAGETVGLLGESGCGKSTLGKAILRLVDASSGAIFADGVDITKLSGKSLRPFRRRTQMIFQDPFSSLNPRQRVYDILSTALRVHGVGDRVERARRIREIAGRVHLTNDSLERYPHEFSGGQRQRIGIARALVLRPSLVICDEPVSALDMSIQAQILNLLVELKAELNLSYLFISHDLSVVRYMADRVLVMRQGKIVEAGNRQNIWTRPQHPFTQGLIQFAAAKGTRTGKDYADEPGLELLYGSQE